MTDNEAKRRCTHHLRTHHLRVSPIQEKALLKEFGHLQVVWNQRIAESKRVKPGRRARLWAWLAKVNNINSKEE